ncbi:MAG: ABC transporter ATP-binding protein [Pseudonocardiaceae bacterium]
MTTSVAEPRSMSASTTHDEGPACECRGLSVELDSSEGPRRILAGVDLKVAEGELVSVMGRSGTGKTTLLRVLGGLLAPTSGSTVEFHGRPVDGPPEGVVFVFQNYAASLLSWRTVERNVALGLEGKVDRPEMRERVAEALSMVGLAKRAKDYPWRLSGGMQQRVQLARALAVRPSALLMDEPFGALDAMTKGALQDELLKVQERTAATVLFVTHDIDEAVYLSDRVVILDGSPATIAQEIKVDLPRPRDPLATKELPEFLKLRRAVYDAIVESHD